MIQSVIQLHISYYYDFDSTIDFKLNLPNLILSFNLNHHIYIYI